MAGTEKQSKIAAAKKQAEKKANAKNKQGFFKSTIAELKKVHWPSKKDVGKYTVVVLISVVVMSAVLWVFDSLLSLGLSAIIK